MAALGCHIQRLLGADFGAESFLESVDATTGINDLLFAGIERMAAGANINMNVASVC